MCDSPSLGALKKYTGEYIYPLIANKSDKYICPDCKKDLILKKGNIRIHHFSHIKDDNPCNYYSRPSESQIHKDAKMLLKNVLDNKKQIIFIRECNDNDSSFCNSNTEEYEIPEITSTSEIVLEYSFNYNGLKIADVAYIDNNEIVCLFEIYNTHKTEEINRPEPWFEINAIELINTVNINNDMVKIKCIRKYLCQDCKLIKCSRCDNLCPIAIMNSNRYDKTICKVCYCYFFLLKIFLIVPFQEKDEIKKYGGKFDSTYKKWYIDLSNKYKETILLRWKEWTP
jgi:hypothetical protein